MISLAASLVLCTGVWCLAVASLPVRSLSWFIVGTCLGLLWALHPSTAPARGCKEGERSLRCSLSFAASVACMLGLFFALFQPAGRYVVGALGAVVIAYGLKEAGLSLETWALALAGFGGALLALRFEKSMLCGLSSLLGSFGLALMLQWWLRLGWLMLRNIHDPDEYTRPVEHLARILGPDCGFWEHLVFATLWLLLCVAGLTVQLRLFGEPLDSGSLQTDPVLFGSGGSVEEQLDKSQVEIADGVQADTLKSRVDRLGEQVFVPSQASHQMSPDDDIYMPAPAMGSSECDL